jgi:hypothetical protein
LFKLCSIQAKAVERKGFKNMAATGSNTVTIAPHSFNYSQVLTDSMCQCCMELKSEVLSVKCELNSVIEIMKILKENQDKLLSQVLSIVNTTVYSGNTNAASNEDSRSNWKSESFSK